MVLSEQCRVPIEPSHRLKNRCHRAETENRNREPKPGQRTETGTEPKPGIETGTGPVMDGIETGIETGESKPGQGNRNRESKPGQVRLWMSQRRRRESKPGQVRLLGSQNRNRDRYGYGCPNVAAGNREPKPGQVRLWMSQRRRRASAQRFFPRSSFSAFARRLPYATSMVFWSASFRTSESASKRSMLPERSV